MKREQRNKVYGEAVTTWGLKSQLEMAQEEATELALAVRKHIRKGTIDTLTDLISEIADVEIMIEQMELMYNIRSKIDTEKEFKVNRLRQRLKNKSFEELEDTDENYTEFGFKINGN